MVKLRLILFVLFFAGGIFSNLSAKVKQYQQEQISKVWVADQGDGTYKNPILYADYSDPDVVRVGDDYYMTSSSFNCVPGLPILHSKDLVNWKLVGYGLQKQVPVDVFNTVQHGKGVWAPCIRFYAGEFYIFYPDPDYGIYMIKAKKPEGPWSEPLLIKSGKGIIDPAPLWDDDGKAYLGYAYAGSRAGIKSVLVVCSMSPDATKVYDDEVMIFDGHESHQTVEGPKFYKRNGYYYVFAPAGGVSTGWQLVLRSKNITGPYEEKVVMAQGSTNINGPHQGAWVDTQTGENWFVHFQDLEAYGRVVHLNPMKWINDWPVIGIDKDGDGTGEPVTNYKKPNVGVKSIIMTPPESDEFNGSKLGLQWQWHANKFVTWGFPSGHLGYFRLNCVPKIDGFKNLWDVSSMLLQKFPASEFTATTKLTFNANFNGEETGLVVMGLDYAYISLKKENDKLYVSHTSCLKAEKGGSEVKSDNIEVTDNTIYFRVKVKKGAACSFSYSLNGKKFIPVGNDLMAKPGKWIGAKVGFFALREGKINNSGYVDIDWFRVE